MLDESNVSGPVSVAKWLNTETHTQRVWGVATGQARAVPGKVYEPQSTLLREPHG